MMEKQDGMIPDKISGQAIIPKSSRGSYKNRLYLSYNMRII